MSRVIDALLERLDELDDEIERDSQEEWTEDGAIPETWQSAKERIDEFKEILRHLIQGKTHWLDAGMDYGVLFRLPVPEWYVDYQEDIAQMIIIRQFINDLSNITSRLKVLPTLVLASPPPINVRIFLEEAARCFLLALFRASTALSRSALEAALEGSLPREALQEFVGQGDKIRRTIDRAYAIGRLDDARRDDAHLVRRQGNSAVHGQALSKGDAENALLAVRRTVEHLCRGATAQQKSADEPTS